MIWLFSSWNMLKRETSVIRNLRCRSKERRRWRDSNRRRKRIV